MLPHQHIKFFGKFLFLILLSIPVFSFAQKSEFELITDRPDQTESSAVVPLKYLQIETGFVMENSSLSSIDQKSFAYNTSLLRYGLLENLELRLGLEYLGNHLHFTDNDSTSTLSGTSPLYTGFKIKIAEENQWFPEIAFLGGLVLPFTAHEKFKPSYPAANLRFAFSHTLSEILSIGYNIGVEWDGDSAIPGYFYSLAAGIGISDKTGFFLESYGLIPETGNQEHLVDAGFTYLLIPNLQLDISAGLGINNNAPDNFFSIGLSYRIPE